MERCPIAVIKGRSYRIDKGSNFRIDLPVALAQAEEVDVSTAPRKEILGLEAGQPGWRVLVVEDNDMNRLLLSHLLTEVGFDIREAENGQAAVDLFQNYRPHLIWMDMRMPVMNGYEAATEIRNLEGGDAVKIVAITASAFKEERERILESGCDEVVHKPFHDYEIFETMAQQLGVRYVYKKE